MLHTPVDDTELTNARVFAGGVDSDKTIYVTLGDDGIESYDFDVEDIVRISWDDIEEYSLLTKESFLTKGKRLFLVFHMKVLPAIINGPGAWGGANPARPTLELTSFSQHDRQQILDTVACHVRPAEEADNPLIIGDKPQFRKNLEQISSYPWAVYSLIAVNAVVWLAMPNHGANSENMPADMLLAWGGNAASEVQRDEWWRLLTSLFLHGSSYHIAANMVGLYYAGETAERIYGKRLLLIIYFGSGLISSAVSLHFAAQHAVSIGASGSVFGLAGAHVVGVLQHRDKLPDGVSKQMAGGMAVFIIYNLLAGFRSVGIDNAAHVGGLIAGGLIAWILPERFNMDEFLKERNRRARHAVALACAATACLAFAAPRAAVDIRSLLASEQKLEQGMERFNEAIKTLKVVDENVKSGKMNIQKATELRGAVYEPLFRQLAEDLSQAQFPPGDPHEPLQKDLILASRLLTEMLAMNPVYQKGDSAHHPADPVRTEQIEKEIAEVSARIDKEVETLKKR